MDSKEGKPKKFNVDNMYETTKIIVTIVIVVIVLVVLLLLLLYCRHKLKNVQPKPDHPKYEADQRLAQQHFDNLVYTCQVDLDNGTSTVVNSAVTKVKQSKDDLNANDSMVDVKLYDTYHDAEDKETRTKGACAEPLCMENSALKKPNMEPNIYQTIEEIGLLKEPYYEEIKEKCVDDAQYDHLDYNRPKCGREPHYHFMDGSLSKPQAPKS